MNSEGIVKRRNQGVVSTTGKTNAKDSDEEIKGDSGWDDDVIEDSKETRLTLLEEVLLIGLKDREVRLFFFHVEF